MLRAGQRVVDLGCWPGGWLQVASRAVGPRGRVVGVDRQAVDELAVAELGLDNVVALAGDFSEAAVLDAVLAEAGGAADVVLCDAAPKLTGVRATDRANEEALLEAVEAALPRLLAPGGTLLCKILDAPEAQAAVKGWRRRFEKSRVLRPAASRKGSSEQYFLGTGWAGPP